jgi:hypothetical protein
VISNLALLGTTWPGVTSLEDLEQTLSENGPVLEPAPIEGSSRTSIGEGSVERFITAKVGKQLKASVDLGCINRTFANELRAGNIPQYKGDAEVGPQTWWWPRSLQADDGGKLSLILDDDEGNLLQMPFSIKGDAVSWSDPFVVKEDYSPVGASGELTGPRILASWPHKPADKPQEAKTMKITAEVDQAKLAQRLGLPEDADEATIQKAIEGEEIEPTPTPPAPAPTTASAAQIPEGMVLVDQETLKTVQAGAAAGASAAKTLAEAKRDRVISAAIRGEVPGDNGQARIVAASRETWEQRWDVNPEETETLLSASVDKGGLAAVIPAGG